MEASPIFISTQFTAQNCQDTYTPKFLSQSKLKSRWTLGENKTYLEMHRTEKPTGIGQAETHLLDDEEEELGGLGFGNGRRRSEFKLSISLLIFYSSPSFVCSIYLLLLLCRQCEYLILYWQRKEKPLALFSCLKIVKIHSTCYARASTYYPHHSCV